MLKRWFRLPRYFLCFFFLYIYIRSIVAGFCIESYLATGGGSSSGVWNIA